MPAQTGGAAAAIAADLLLALTLQGVECGGVESVETISDDNC